MSNASTEEQTKEAFEATIASVSRSVWTAKLTFYVIKPLQHLIAMVYCGAVLYAGTWIVVFALRHSGALK